MNCRKTNVLPTSCVCGGVRSSRPTGAVQKEFARPRERRGEGTPPYGSSPERICPTEGTAGCRDVTPSIRSRSENRGTRPRFSGICKANSIKYVRKAHEKRHARKRAFRVPPGRRAHCVCASPPNLAFGKAGGQACRSRPHKIPRKSRGVYLTFTPLPAPYPRAPSLAPSGQFTLWRRGLVRRADERGLSPPVSQGTGGVSKGDSVPLRVPAPSGAQRSFPDTPRPSGTPAPDW